MQITNASGIKTVCLTWMKDLRKKIDFLVGQDGFNSVGDIYVWMLPSLRVLLLFISSLSSIITNSELCGLLVPSFVSSLGPTELLMTTSKRTTKEATKNTLTVEATSMFGRDDSTLAGRGASFFAFARGWEVDEFTFFAFLPPSDKK